MIISCADGASNSISHRVNCEIAVRLRLKRETGLDLHLRISLTHEAVNNLFLIRDCRKRNLFTHACRLHCDVSSGPRAPAFGRLITVRPLEIAVWLKPAQSD